jgi:hypothetical protein
MRLVGPPFTLIACLALPGCDQAPATDYADHHGGGFQGIGTYPAGRVWSQQSGVPRQRNAAAATIDDDEQIIVTVDSRTGEIRQCGNLSGHCVISNPWVGRSAPVGLIRHAADLDRPAAEADAASNAAVN